MVDRNVHMSTPRAMDGRAASSARGARRRRVDWDVIFDEGVPAPKILSLDPPSELASLVSAAACAPSTAAVHRVLRHAVELARGVVQLERAAIFLLDAKNNAMVGTWGTDHLGETVDEHHIMYEFGAGDRLVFERAQKGLPWTVFDDCPLVTQLEDETRVLGRGWVACTAIQGPHGALGILFNDAALTRAPFDEAKQARAALLCSLLGHALDRRRRQLLRAPAGRSLGLHPLVRKVTTALAADPTLTCEQLGKRVRISAGRLARTFKKETHTSVVCHRNELRLSRFFDRLDVSRANLLDAALDAGFGSYAQFHRVFRARFGQGPRAYLAARAAGASGSSDGARK
jgi:AraC-like DNA-binding protein